MEAREFTITLAHPHPATRPNARVHRMTQWRHQQLDKTRARTFARAAWGNQYPMQKARLDVIWKARTHMAPDPDNIIAMLKSYIDGVEKGGVLANDRHLTLGHPEIERRAGEGVVILKFTEL